MNIYNGHKLMLKVDHHRGLMLSLASVFGVFVLGLGTMFAQSGPVNNPSPTFEPIELTATYIVAQATMSVYSPPTITPMPTITAKQLAEQKTAYIEKLETVAGFSHPLFETIANDLEAQEIKFSRFLQLSELEVDAQKQTVADHQFVVLIVRRVGYDAAFSRILLFRLFDQDAVLLNNPPQIASETFLYIGFDAHGFTDWNNNGLPDIAIYASYGGSCRLPRLNVLEIQPNNEIADISPQPKDVYPARFMDINRDGIREIEALQPRAGAYSVSMTRWFGWENQQYVDISAKHPELYLPRINDIAQRLVSNSGCLERLVDLELQNFLADFYVMGRLSEGWSELQRLMKINCSPSQLREHDKLFKDLEQWMNLLLTS